MKSNQFVVHNFGIGQLYHPSDAISTALWVPDHNDWTCGHGCNVRLGSYLLSNVVKLVHEPDAYIAYLTQRLSGTSAATANTGNLVVPKSPI